MDGVDAYNAVTWALEVPIFRDIDTYRRSLLIIILFVLVSLDTDIS